MAANMDALLRIATRVTGAEQVTALQSKFKQVEGAANSLTSRIGPLGGALGALAPVATVGGLAALVGKTIDAGDALNDMSQRTGVSVEALAKFKKAAVGNSVDIDVVAKSLGKLSKGMYEVAQTGKGPAADALKTLGISATDASGKLKSADQVTLEIASKFKAMPDGVEKTALAMQLFGKSGADMIPMLNMGGDAIDKLSVKMTGAFAEKADAYKTKLELLGGKVGGLAAGITVALLPALDAVATVLTVVIDGFSKLPGPIQAIVGSLALLAISFTVLAPIVASVVTVLGAFQGLAIGATIAGWLGALGPLMTGLSAFAAAIVGWPLLIGAALVAVGVLIYAFRDDIGKVVGAIGKTIYGAVDAVNKTIRDGIGAVLGWLQSAIGNVAGALVAPFDAAAGAIKGVLSSVLQFGAQVINGFLGAVNQMINAVNSVAARLRLPQLPTFGAVSVPSFAGGGYTGNAPRSGGLDGQGGFMAMLHPRESVVDHARTGAGGGVPNITIKTGEVLQMPDGSQWVSMADLEQAMRATAAGVIGQLRTPAGRIAMGGA
jgi:phage-related minor tail protein